MSAIPNTIGFGLLAATLATAGLACANVQTPVAKSATTTVAVENTLPAARAQETIEIPWRSDNTPCVGDSNGGAFPCQIVEGKLLFQSDFAPGEKKTFYVSADTKGGVLFPPKAYGRYVPERMDDYAWENDRIAFRIYGPALMEPAPKGEGLVSSSVDIWVKRTRSLVIDKWYKSKAYHQDHGEGLDNYKCGAGRGCGGIGVWNDGTLFVSNNWVTQKMLCYGPVRTVAEFTYAPWECGNGVRIAETRRISLDAGSNLSRFESRFTITGADSATIAVGLDVSKEHKHAGILAGGAAQGFYANWEAEQKPNGIIGTAILLSAAKTGEAKDASHVFLTAPARSGKPFVWHAGAGWSRSGDFADAAAWQAYVENAMLRLRHPLKVTVWK